MSLEDFPTSESRQAEIFIHWVKLCNTIGRLSDKLRDRTETSPIPLELAHELIDWEYSLPEHLKLSFTTDRTQQFDRDVHLLHLPYLTAITLLYISTSTQPLPRAYTPAILAASYLARILRDFLAREVISFLPGVSSWYISIAILALLDARRIDCLNESATEEINLLILALKELSRFWHSAKMFLTGFNKLLNSSSSPEREITNISSTETYTSTITLTDLTAVDGVNYLDFFPGATTETNRLFKVLLTENPPFIINEARWGGHDLNAQLLDLFGQRYDDFDYDALTLS